MSTEQPPGTLEALIHDLVAAATNGSAPLLRRSGTHLTVGDAAVDHPDAPALAAAMAERGLGALDLGGRAIPEVGELLELVLRGDPARSRGALATRGVAFEATLHSRSSTVDYRVEGNLVSPTRVAGSAAGTGTTFFQLGGGDDAIRVRAFRVDAPRVFRRGELDQADLTGLDRSAIEREMARIGKDAVLVLGDSGELFAEVRVSRALERPIVLSRADVEASSFPDGVDPRSVLARMDEVGEQAVAIVSRQGELRVDVVRDPRICRDINPGAVVMNLEVQPPDMSGWRVHDYDIFQTACWNCGRCAAVCPDSAIKVYGEGREGYHRIDPEACKGCGACWAECHMTAGDAVSLDGSPAAQELRHRHSAIPRTATLDTEAMRDWLRHWRRGESR